MSATVSIAILVFFFVLGAFETIAPRKLDGLMARLAGRRYVRGASERLRVRWIRLNGIFILVLCALMSFAVGAGS